MNRTLTLIAVILLISCEDPISLEVPPGESKLVVEGVITDQLGLHPIRLSNTAGFSEPGSTPKISGANVSVTIFDGGNIAYSESTTEEGLYLAENPFQGEAGNAYQLHFTMNDGNSYESDFQTLEPGSDITSVGFERDPFSNDEVYIVTINTRDTPETEDFYRWKIYRNDQLLGTVADIFLRSDRLFNGNPFSVEFDLFEFRIGDSCRVEQFSLTESAFDFFRLIQVQAGGLGESTSTAPTQVIGNIRNIDDPEEEILGFFYSTAITEGNVVIRQ